MSKNKIKTRGTLLKNISNDVSEKVSLEDIGVKDDIRFKEMPECCPNCESNNFVGLEILGACEGPLLWFCEPCKSKFLKYTKRTTIKHIKRANELYSSPYDWEQFPHQVMN